MGRVRDEMGEQGTGLLGPHENVHILHTHARERH